MLGLVIRPVERRQNVLAAMVLVVSLVAGTHAQYAFTLRKKLYSTVI
jgi:hypothetical protein